MSSHLPLCAVAQIGDREVAKRLLQEGENVNERDVVRHIDAIFLSWLLGYGQTGRAAIHYAAKYGKIEVLKYLMEAGADKEIKDDVRHVNFLWL